MRKCQEKAIKRLHAKAPEATLAECERFQDAFGKNAFRHLAEYLHFRKTQYRMFCEQLQHKGLDESSSEEILWQEAATMALALHPHNESVSEDGNEVTTAAPSETTSLSNSSRESIVYGENIEIAMNGDTSTETPAEFVGDLPGKQLAPTHLSDQNDKILPRFLYWHKKVDCDGQQLMQDVNGNILIQALPAKMETHFTPEQYTMALALSLEHLLGDSSANGSKQASILLDVRPGQGWPNVNVVHMVGFIRHIANVLHNLNPNRLSKCVIFPIPRPAIAIWNFAIKPFLDSKLRQLIDLVPGPGAMIKSPPPNDKLVRYCAPQDLDFLENHRVQSFKTNSRVVARNDGRSNMIASSPPAAHPTPQRS